MTLPQTSPNIELIPASLEQQPILDNLLQLYIHDFSELIRVELGADGRFVYPELAMYWQDSVRHPFLIRVDGALAGFAFVQKGSQISGDPGVWDMREFFVVRAYRRSRIGMHAAHEVWRKFPGKWEVRVIDRNQRARAFWAQAIEEFLGWSVAPTRFEKQGEGRQLFSFESGNAA